MRGEAHTAVLLLSFAGDLMTRSGRAVKEIEVYEVNQMGLGVGWLLPRYDKEYQHRPLESPGLAGQVKGDHRYHLFPGNGFIKVVTYGGNDLAS